jgi:solute carrier family 9B (sodium/hydrogen exchanger), member 1/2
MTDFEEIIHRRGLPRVGQTVRSKDYGTMWRVMEEKEVWETIANDPRTGETRMVPAIYLSYWKIRDDAPPGVGKMMGFIYTLLDNTFALHWEIAS